MLRTSLLIQLLLVGLFLCFGGCNNDNDDFANNFALDSLTGRTYRLAITNRTGLSTPLTALDAFKMAFQTEEIYLATPETELLSPFEGAYIYTKHTRNSGELRFMPKIQPEEVTYTCTLWFSDSVSGDYAGMLIVDDSVVGVFFGAFQQI